MSIGKTTSKKHIIWAIVGLAILIASVCALGGIYYYQVGQSSNYPIIVINNNTTPLLLIEQPSMISSTESAVCNYSMYKNPKEFHRIYYK